MLTINFIAHNNMLSYSFCESGVWAQLTLSHLHQGHCLGAQKAAK